MPVHTMFYRDVQYEISAEDGIERSWAVYVDARAAMTGYVVRTIRSSSFRTAIREAQVAIDAMLDGEQTA